MLSLTFFLHAVPILSAPFAISNSSTSSIDRRLRRRDTVTVISTTTETTCTSPSATDAQLAFTPLATDYSSGPIPDPLLSLPASPPQDGAFSIENAPIVLSFYEPSPTPSPAHPSLMPSLASATSTARIAEWSPPPVYHNLSSFGVQRFASGEQNMELVDGVPASASSFSLSLPTLIPLPHIPNPLPGILPPLPPLIPDPSDPDETQPPWNNDTTVMQFLYPAHSSNPSSRPVGGGQIYFSPFDISSANSITFSYSVFFPDDFIWVRGGKLPGLYGGHQTCSGGDDAERCFSTRMMWRSGGDGELYLYAPKHSQHPSVCQTPPNSVCNQEYGFSIGRGSFTFARGGWTHLSQTVTLNTPGKQDGEFLLLVNGVPRLNLTRILYRTNPSSTNDTSHAQSCQCSLASRSGNLLNIGSRGSDVLPEFVSIHNDDIILGPRDLVADLLGPIVSILGLPLLGPSTTSVAVAAAPTKPPEHTPHSEASPVLHSAGSEDKEDQMPISFSGIFFSTFFGGHGQEYASPRDQYTWFKDFALTINH